MSLDPNNPQSCRDHRIHATVEDLQAQLKRAANDWNAAVRALNLRNYEVTIYNGAAYTGSNAGEIHSFEIGQRTKVAA